MSFSKEDERAFDTVKVRYVGAAIAHPLLSQWRLSNKSLIIAREAHPVIYIDQLSAITKQVQKPSGDYS